MSRLSDNDDNTRAIDINDNDTDVPLSLTTSNNPRNTNDYYRDEKSPPQDDVRNDADGGVQVKEEPMENENKRNGKETEGANSPKKESMETNRENKSYTENNEASPRPSSISPKPSSPMLERPENNDAVNNNVSNDDNFTDDEDVNDDERFVFLINEKQNGILKKNYLFADQQ